MKIYNNVLYIFKIIILPCIQFNEISEIFKYEVGSILTLTVFELLKQVDINQRRLLQIIY